MINLTNNNHWLLEQSRKSGERIALLTNETKITYGTLERYSKKAALSLTEEGVVKNDHVAIITDHSIYFIIIINALWLIGAIPVPLNPHNSKEELLQMITKSGSKFLISSKDLSPLKNNVKIITSIDIEEFPEKVEINLKIYNTNSICVMLFTSGSTGESKCVKLTFENIFESTKSTDSFIKHSQNDIWLSSLPFYHIGGFSIITRSIISGCRNAIPKSVGKTFLHQSIKTFNPSLISLVDTMMRNLLEVYEKPWEGLRHIFIGGGPISTDVIQASLKKNWPITTVYGSTETSSMVTLSSTQNLRAKGSTGGVPLKGVKISIENGESNKGIGRIVISSKSVSGGYYNPSDNESDCLDNHQYYSNDLGNFDHMGNLQILGRSDDIIISGGENISLVEIRDTLKSDFNLSDFVLLPVKDRKWGQAYIIVTDDKEIDSTDKIMSYLKNKVARYKLPKAIVIIDKIDRNNVGKVLKTKIREKLNFDFL